MSIKVVIEFQAKAGKRSELHRSLESLLERQSSGLEGYLGSTRYEVVGEPDRLVEIAEWESVEARAKHLEDAKATGAFASVFALLEGPPKATILRDLRSASAQ